MTRHFDVDVSIEHLQRALLLARATLVEQTQNVCVAVEVAHVARDATPSPHTPIQRRFHDDYFIFGACGDERFFLTVFF